jgi:hypothetical protein
MFEDKDLKILLGNSMPLPEEDRDQWGYEYETEEDALHSYYLQTVLGAIGTNHFKESYNTFINRIKQLELKTQIELANAIIDKIRLRHNFEFFTTVDILSQHDVNTVYELIEFIEYDHEAFIVRIWKLLKPKIENIKIRDYCLRNWNKIIKEIEDQIDSYDFNWMISEFLGTNNKISMIKWFCEKSENLYTLIKLNLIGKE